MKIPGFNICVNISIDPGMGADLKPAARELLKSKVKSPVGKATTPAPIIGPWESPMPTQDSFSVNEDPYPKPISKSAAKYERSPRGLKEKPKPGYYY